MSVCPTVARRNRRRQLVARATTALERNAGVRHGLLAFAPPRDRIGPFGPLEAAVAPSAGGAMTTDGGCVIPTIVLVLMVGVPLFNRRLDRAARIGLPALLATLIPFLAGGPQ